MKKTYENTIDEAVEPSVRLAEMTGAVSRQRWMSLLIAPLAFAVFYLVLSCHETQVRLIGATFMTIVTTIATMLTVKDQIRRHVRRIIKKAQGSAGPVPCEYELTDDHLIFRKLGQELRFSWRTVQKVTMTPTAIEVVMHPLGIALIPRRIFASLDELQEWFRFIEEHRAISHTSDGIRQPADGSPKLSM